MTPQFLATNQVQLPGTLCARPVNVWRAVYQHNSRRPLCTALGSSCSTTSAAITPTQLHVQPGQRMCQALPYLPHKGIQACELRRRCSTVAQVSKNPVQLAKQEFELASNKLDSVVRERVENAITSLTFRATVGDVAARAGVTIGQADTALKALACDSQAALEVSSEGDVVYAFPRDFVGKLRSKSLTQRLWPIGIQAARAIGYLARVSFGAALVISVVTVWLAITAILSSSRERDDRGGGRGGGGFGYGPRFNIWLNIADIFTYFDPYYWRSQQQRREAGESMSFLPAVFSFVFGDGDPNAGYEEARWRTLGELIRAKGGAVTAEEMAPYLDPPTSQQLDASDAGSGMYADESFVLPALLRLGGEPVVDDTTGALLYVFPSLQRTGTEMPSRVIQVESAAYESEYELTAASNGQAIAAVALGVANVVGVSFLGTLLADPMNRQLLAVQGFGFVMGLMPVLQTYAAAFFTIPAVRWFVDQTRNRQIAQRNAAREAAVDVLDGALAIVTPARRAALTAKLAAARQLGQRRVLQRQDAIFRTDREDDAGKAVAVREMEDWDAALRKHD